MRLTLISVVFSILTPSIVQADLHRLLDPIGITHDYPILSPNEIDRRAREAIRDVFGDDAASVVGWAQLPEYIGRGSAELALRKPWELLSGEKTLQDIFEEALSVPLEAELRRAHTELSPLAAPIPQQIKQFLYLGFDASLVDSARFVDTSLDPNIAAIINSINVAIRAAFGEQTNHAVVVGNVIAFDSATEDLEFWAHELVHVEQYQRWGFSQFAKRYLASHSSIEGEAERRAAEFCQDLVSVFEEATGRAAGMSCQDLWAQRYLPILLPAMTNATR